MILSDDRIQNLKLVQKACKAVYSDSSILADLALTQAALESRLLGKPSNLALRFNNLFGIKDVDGVSKVDLETTECNSKGCWKESQPFEVYKTLEDSIKAHKRLMDRPRYSAVKRAKTLNEAFVQIVKCGYATDPKYTTKLQSVYNDIKKLLSF